MGPWAKVKSTSVYPSTCVCDWLSPGRLPSFTVSLTTVSPETLLSWCHMKPSSVAPVGLSTMGRGEVGRRRRRVNTYDSQITSFYLCKAKDNLAHSHTLLLRFLKFLKWGFIKHTPCPLHCMFKLTSDVDCFRKSLHDTDKCLHMWLSTCLCTRVCIYAAD